MKWYRNTSSQGDEGERLYSLLDIIVEQEDSCYVWEPRLRLRLHISVFFFFFHPFVRLAITIHAQSLTFLSFFQPISGHRSLFMNLQISLSSNFFIKNESHNIIHTFKNYFITIFFSFLYQFSTVFK